MAYSFIQFNNRVAEIEEWFRKELTLLRTGRAATAILDEIKIDSYGSLMPIAHVANIAMEDPRTLKVTPWDKGQVKAIEAAIQKADIGLSVVGDSDGLRIIFPELTSERRAQIVKMLHGKLEDARISVRKERELVLNDMKAKEKDGSLSEDEHFKAKEELQKLIDTANEKLEEMARKKEVEVVS